MLDLCPSLAEQARQRVDKHGWTKFVIVTVADACDPNAPGLPKAGTVDVVTFSYAVSMIPDWQKAIENAGRLLKKGGYLCVCDFTVDKSQTAMMQTFWTKVS